jgi:hypothetical protein
MARVKIKAIRNGVWKSPQGDVPVDQARLQHWSSQFKAMRESGLNIPVSWGHSQQAVPNHQEQTYLSARLNAGYLEDMKAGTGDLDIGADCPGLNVDNGKLVSVAKMPDTGLPVTTAIKEVSLGIAKVFIDGKGKLWNDVITHMAVTPHPVVSGQDGFQQLGTVQEFSTITIDAKWLEHEMPPESGAKASEGKKTGDGGKKKADDPPAKEGKDEGKTYSFDALLSDLHELGIALPDDTKPDESGWERLYVAVHALKNKGGVSQSVTEERPEHLMMALEASNPAAARLLKKQQGEIEKMARESREARWKRCQDRLSELHLPQAVIEKRFLSLSNQELSLAGLDDKIVEQVERDLDLAETIWSDDLKTLSIRLSQQIVPTDNPLLSLKSDMVTEMKKHSDDLIYMATGKRPEESANGVKK